MRRIRKVYLQNAAGDRWGLNGENGVYVSSLAGFGYTLSPTYADLTRGFFLAVSGESEPQGTVPFTVYGHQISGSRLRGVSGAWRYYRNCKQA